MESASCPSLSGDGVVGDVTGCGHIDLDKTLSVNNLGNSGGWGGLDIRLNGTNAGEYGRLVASGDVSLNYGRLLPSAGFNPQPGQVFTILEKTSPDPIANAIFGPEGTITTLNGMPFRISYVGGDGNDASAATPGVQLNAVIKSGSNQLRGSLYYDYENEGFQGSNVDDRLREIFAQWRDSRGRLTALVRRAPALHEVEPLVSDLGDLGTVGLAALDAFTLSATPLPETRDAHVAILDRAGHLIVETPAPT